MNKVQKRKLHKQLGQNLYSRREAQRLSQRDLAERVGCTRENISRVERGLQGMTATRMIEICHALDCTPNMLFKGCWED